MSSLYIDFYKPSNVDYEVTPDLSHNSDSNPEILSQLPISELIDKLAPPTTIKPVKFKEQSSSSKLQTHAWEMSYTDEQKEYVLDVDLGKVTPVDDILLNSKVFEEYYITDVFTSDYHLTIEFKNAKGVYETIVKELDIIEHCIEKTRNQYSTVPRFESNKTIHLGITAQYLRYTLRRTPKSEEKSQPLLALLNFEYNTDFDENGILYFIGSDGGCRNTWTNPCTNGKVKMTKSHDKMYNDDMKDYNLIERDDIQSTYFGGSNPQYFTIDLGQEVSVAVTSYTLRHGYKYDNSFIQDFTFSASVDGVEWDVLDEQIETPFTYGFQTMTFPVKQTNKFYNYFKLLQKGDYSIPDGKPGAPYMCINGLEIYGQMNVIMKPARLSELSFTMLSYSAEPINFKHVEDFDTNGVLYYIGSNGLTEKWQNPAKTGLVNLTLSHRLGKLEMNKNNTIGRDAIENFWGDSTPIWFSVDLGEGNYVRITDYTLRHGYGASNSYLHDWEFLASRDGIKWDLLHNGSRSPFVFGFQTHTFKIRPTTEYYRFFKVIQKGNYYLEGSEGSPFMCIAGFEIYGDVLFNVHNITPFTKSLVVKTVDTNKVFKHSSDFDTNGLLYYIGTNGLTEEFKNPLTTEKVRLMLSHDLYSEDQNVSSILERDITQSTFWGGSSPQWMVLDVGENYKLNCKAFTLRHGFHVANSFICDWEFQASEDLAEWTTLYVGLEPPFTKGYETKTFTTFPTTTFYRYFRVIQKGSYSTGNGNISDGAEYLCLVGIELYGRSLIKENKESPKVEPEEGTFVKKFDYVGDGDTNGLIYWIGSSGGVSQFVNPARTGNLDIVLSEESMYSPEMSKFDITGRTTPRNTYWGGKCPQWFYIDLGVNNQFSVNAYTLRHGFSGANSFLCDWEFSGSNDLFTWEVLHSGLETPFEKGFEMVTFKLGSTSKPFRFFRVLQKGNYTLEKGTFGDGGAPYLCISGLEVYGEMKLAVDSPSKFLGYALGMPNKNPSRTLMFPVSEEFDKTGLIYWLGSKGNTDIFTSPSELGIVTVTTSHPINEGGVVHDILSRNKENLLYWGGSNPQWFMLDLGEKNNFSCNAYTIKHGGKANSYPRNWELQASNDGKSWEVLHANEKSEISSDFQSETIRIKPTTVFYRYFRFLQKEGSSSGEPILSICGFELFGLKNFTLVKKPRRFDYKGVLTQRCNAEIYYFNKNFHQMLLKATETTDGAEKQKVYETIRNITSVLPKVPDYFESIKADIPAPTPTPTGDQECNVS